MVRVLAVITKKKSEVVEYVVLEDQQYSSLDAFLVAAHSETLELSKRHRLPNDELELFDGSDRSLDSFFRMFPNLKLTSRSVNRPAIPALRSSPDR
jgi:hypothetical protein